MPFIETLRQLHRSAFFLERSGLCLPLDRHSLGRDLTTNTPCNSRMLHLAPTRGLRFRWEPTRATIHSDAPSHLTSFPHSLAPRSLVASVWHPLGRTIVGLGRMEQSGTDPRNLLEDPSCEPRPFFPTLEGNRIDRIEFQARVSQRSFPGFGGWRDGCFGSCSQKSASDPEGKGEGGVPRRHTVLVPSPRSHLHPRSTENRGRFSKIAMGRSRSWEGEELDRMASCSTDRRGEIPVLGKRALATKVHASDWRTRGSLKRDGNGLLRTAGRGKERHGRPTAQSVPKTGAQMPPGTCGRTSNELEVQREPKHSNWTEADATMRCLRGSWKRTKIQVIEHVQKSTLNSCPRPMRC